MADQQTQWAEFGKWVGGFAAFVAAVRSYFKARNANHADRLTRLERDHKEDHRIMAEIRNELNDMKTEVDTRLYSVERRIRQTEMNATDLDREVRDMLQRMIESIDRRLHSPRQDPEPGR